MSWKCPKCGSDNTRKSRARPGERTVSMIFKIPLHCRDCKERFWAQNYSSYFISGTALLIGSLLVYTVWLVIHPTINIERDEKYQPDQLVVDKASKNAEANGPDNIQKRVATTAVNLTKNASDNRFYAVQLYQENAKKGNADAQYQLGILYLTGKGTLQDYEEASKWLMLAAEQNYAPAQYELGILYHTGYGVEIDQSESYMWLNLAAAAGIEQAIMAREKVGRSLGTRQLIQAQKASREWLLNKSQGLDDMPEELEQEQ